MATKKTKKVRVTHIDDVREESGDRTCWNLLDDEIGVNVHERWEDR